MKVERLNKATAEDLVARPSEDHRLQTRIEHCEALMRLLSSFEHDDWSHRVVMRMVERVVEREQMRLRAIQLHGKLGEVPKPALPEEWDLFVRDNDADAFFDALFHRLREDA